MIYRWGKKIRNQLLAQLYVPSKWNKLDKQLLLPDISVIFKVRTAFGYTNGLNHFALTRRTKDMQALASPSSNAPSGSNTYMPEIFFDEVKRDIENWFEFRYLFRHSICRYWKLDRTSEDAEAFGFLWEERKKYYNNRAKLFGKSQER